MRYGTKRRLFFKSILGGKIVARYNALRSLCCKSSKNTQYLHLLMQPFFFSFSFFILKLSFSPFFLPWLSFFPFFLFFSLPFDLFSLHSLYISQFPSLYFLARKISFLSSQFFVLSSFISSCMCIAVQCCTKQKKLTHLYKYVNAPL